MSSPESAAPSARPCTGCGAALPRSLLACPTCGRLVHAEELKRLAADAERAEQHGDLTGALAAWRNTLTLLPTAAVQHQRILVKVQGLSAQVPGATASSHGGPGAFAAPSVGGSGAGAIAGSPPHKSGWKKWLAGLGAVGILLAKFKWVLLFVLAKGKVLLIGLTQAKTFLSMAFALGVYATAFGWRFAAGLVVSIYVHEMGHIAWLRRYGIAATAPMFIPGLGAFVRLKQHPATVGEDARVGLAGPVWGAGAAIVALVIGVGLDHPLFVAIARVGAWINLFNLLPVWQLDGGRAFAALARKQRGIVAGVLWMLALSAGDGMLFLLAVAATFRAVPKGTAPAVGDRGVLVTYLVLIVGLTALMAWGGTPLDQAMTTAPARP